MNDPSPPADAVVLLVDDEPDAIQFLERALRSPRIRTVSASSGRDALDVLRSRRIDLVLSDYRMLGLTGVELLSACAKEFPDTRRILITAYSDLPEIVRARASELVSHVIPKPAKPGNVRKIVEKILFDQPTAEPRPGPQRPLEDPSLFCWTARRISRVDGIVIRQHAIGEQTLQLQFVLPRDDSFETLRRDISERWGASLKPRNEKPTPQVRRHPVVRSLSGIEYDQEIFVQNIAGTTAYLAIFPWRREEKITASLGIYSTAPTADMQQALWDAHDAAIHEVSEFRLPQLNAQEIRQQRGTYSPDYDWIVTKDYVGPDRRARPTPFLSRFTLLGRRRQVPHTLRAAAINFVDRLSPVGVWLVGLFLALSLTDTVLTYLFVATGDLLELNPVMRSLLEISPLLFTVVKNLMSVTAIFLVMRFELTRIGLVMLIANVMALVLLDLYWVWVLLGPAA